MPAALHSAEPRFDRDVRPVLERFCIRCHGPEKQKADLRLNQLNANLVSGGDAETWHDVLNKLNLGEMPPEDEPQPTDAQRQQMVGWLLESWPPPSHTRIFFAKGDVADETAFARTQTPPGPTGPDEV